MTHCTSNVLNRGDVLTDSLFTLRYLLKLLKVFTGTESAADAGQNHCANVVRSLGALDCRLQIGHERVTDRVQSIRPIQRNDGSCIPLFESGVAHEITLSTHAVLPSVRGIDSKGTIVTTADAPIVSRTTTSSWREAKLVSTWYPLPASSTVISMRSYGPAPRN